MFLGCSLNFIHAYGCLERIPNAQSLAKEPSRSFGEQTNQFVTLLFADLDDLVYLSCIAWSQLLLSCVQHPPSDLQFTAEGCSCAGPSADTTPELTVKGKRAMARLWLAHKSVLPVLFYSNFLSQKQITQSPICPTGKFMFFRNVLVTSEKQHYPPWCVFGGSDILDFFLKFLMGGQGEMWFYGL